MHINLINDLNEIGALITFMALVGFNAVNLSNPPLLSEISFGNLQFLLDVMRSLSVL